MSLKHGLSRDIDLEVFQAFDSTDESVMRDVDVSESVIRAYRVSKRLCCWRACGSA